MTHCPKCHSRQLRRSPAKNVWERWRKEITGKRPYRCRACHWRGWKPIGSGDDEPSIFHASSAAPDPPNLKGTAFARTDSRSVLDLADLDRFHGPARDDA